MAAVAAANTCVSPLVTDGDSFPSARRCSFVGSVTLAAVYASQPLFVDQSEHLTRIRDVMVEGLGVASENASQMDRDAVCVCSGGVAPPSHSIASLHTNGC